MSADEWAAKAEELEARGYSRCAQIARVQEIKTRQEEADTEYAEWRADADAERRNEAWFEERGYHPERPEVLGPDYWDI